MDVFIQVKPFTSPSIPLQERERIGLNFIGLGRRLRGRILSTCPDNY